MGGSCEREMMCLRMMDLFLMGVGRAADLGADCCNEVASACIKLESAWAEE